MASLETTPAPLETTPEVTPLAHLAPLTPLAPLALTLEARLALKTNLETTLALETKNPKNLHLALKTTMPGKAVSGAQLAQMITQMSQEEPAQDPA